MPLARRAVLAAALGAVALRAAGGAERATLRPWTGAPEAPPIDLLQTDGTPFSLRGLRGKVVLVNFWATWCEPCLAEMPSLQQLRDELGTARFEVLGVNHKEGPGRINAFVAQSGLRFPIVRDTDGAVARAWSARIFPSSYVVDPSGRIRYTLIGEADWTSPALVSTILPLLGPPPMR